MEIRCENCKKDLVIFETIKTNKQLTEELINPIVTKVGIICGICNRLTEIKVEGKFSTGLMSDNTFIDMKKENNGFDMLFEVKNK